MEGTPLMPDMQEPLWHSSITMTPSFRVTVSAEHVEFYTLEGAVSYYRFVSRGGKYARVSRQYRTPWVDVTPS